MEPEPMPPDVVEQDILLDDIKEYRKILSGLVRMIQESTNNNCRDVLRDFNRDLLEEYPYAYSGLDIVYRDVDNHKEQIRKIMDRLEGLDDEDSKRIFKECYECYIYQYYYLGNRDAQ
tara:strand:+ start:3483 stop:3836 length:354 start_codon:yes stop_codon:yes gene_type:complete